MLAPPRTTSPAVTSGKPCECLRQRVLSVAGDPGDAENLAGCHVKETS